jgi:hypothetical protein
MAAIPITFQYTSSRHRYRPSIPSPGPATFPHTRQSLHPRSTQNLTISTTPQFPAQPAIPSPLGSSSTTASTSNTSKRAKSTTPRTLPLDAKVASLKPLLQPILNRCLAFDPTSPTVRSTLGTSKEAMLYGTIRYSRIMDLGNNRSIVPSPREIAREIKLGEGGTGRERIPGKRPPGCGRGYNKQRSCRNWDRKNCQHNWGQAENEVDQSSQGGYQHFCPTRHIRSNSNSSRYRAFQIRGFEKDKKPWTRSRDINDRCECLWNRGYGRWKPVESSHGSRSGCRGQ